MGQILSEEGDQDEAINCLIDALRWDATNNWALLMMGNIFAKYKDDLSTAMKYYDQALIAKPNDHIVLNNIGGSLLQQGKLEEAKKFYLEVLKIDKNYPQTHHALGLIAERENDYHSAFFSTIQAIKNNPKKDLLYSKSLQQAINIAKRIASSDIGKKVYREYRHQLEFEGECIVDIVKDDDQPTAAKFEFAENYNRDKHLLRYKSQYPAVEHLIMHELVHLDFVIEARKLGVNQLFTSTQQHKKLFLNSLEPTVNRLHKMGVAEESIEAFCSGLFDGLNRQVFNTPIDLFIENFLYNQFSELRPYQFLSLYTLIQEGLQAVTDKKIIELTPKDILSKSKIYNLVNALQFKELYGIDFLPDFRASISETNTAKNFYEEYVQYKDDKEAGEEYELVLHWAEDLHLQHYFELIDENEYRNKRTNLDNLLTSIENDPYDLAAKDPLKEREMNKFQQAQKAMGTNMAVVMFMVDALQFFKDKPQDWIKKIAFEIAMEGRQGYSPDGTAYRISSIPNKEFSGYHILAYYYVSWALSIPEMLTQLQLPYDEEYKMAQTMFDGGVK